MKGVIKFGILALLLVSFVGSAIAFHRGAFGNESAKKTMEFGDFTACTEIMKSGLSEERFDDMCERHAHKGDIISERKVMIEQKNALINVACEEDDINKLFEIECPMIDTIDEENFDAFCELHQARQDKDFEKVKELSEELGLESNRRWFGMRRMYRIGKKHRFIQK